MQKASGRVPKDAPTACGRTISGLFHSPSGVLFAFPSRYLFAIGHHGVIRLGGWSPLIRAGFHVSRPTWDPGRPGLGFRLRGFHPLRPDLPVRSPSLPGAMSRSRNPEVQAPRFGLTRFRSPLLARSRLLSFPQGTEMFHFPWCSSSGTIEFIPGCHGSRHGGLPHSETSGSKPVDGSPEIIAVCRVLLRLAMPRHPSCARIRLAGRNPASRLRCSVFYLHVSMLPVVKDLKNWCRGRFWWRRPDSDRRHPACKAGALPTELRPLRADWWA